MFELATSSFISNSKSCLCSLLILLNICRESLYEPLEGLHLHMLCSHSLELLRMSNCLQFFTLWYVFAEHEMLNSSLTNLSHVTGHLTCMHMQKSKMFAKTNYACHMTWESYMEFGHIFDNLSWICFWFV